VLATFIALSTVESYYI